MMDNRILRNVDVSETVAGLKTIKHEANAAIQVLRELREEQVKHGFSSCIKGCDHVHYFAVREDGAYVPVSSEIGKAVTKPRFIDEVF